MAMVRLHAVIHGRVQGGFFRDFTAKEAKRLCLSGWVRNLADGSVESEFQGEEAEVAMMASWLRRGSPLSEVSRVQTASCSRVDGEIGFVVRY